MKTSFARMFLAFTLIAFPKAASADSFYNWTFTGNNGNAAGTFQVNSSNIVVAVLNGTVTGFSGSSTITSLLAPGTFPGNDNVFTSTSPFLTSNGVAFTTNRNINLILISYPTSPTFWSLSDDSESSDGIFSLSQ